MSTARQSKTNVFINERNDRQDPPYVTLRKVYPHTPAPMSVTYFMDGP